MVFRYPFFWFDPTWRIITCAHPNPNPRQVLDGIKSLHLSGLQKIVLQVMEARLHKDQLAETHKLFEQLDVDRTGLIRTPNPSPDPTLALTLP